jgi:ribosomal protein S18 acetylase RimI-like enzyme
MKLTFVSGARDRESSRDLTMTASTHSEVVIRSGRHDELEQIGLVLAAAFRDDPVISWVVRDDDQTEAARLAFFTGYAAEEFEHQRRIQVAERGGEVQAAALWTEPPGGQASLTPAGVRGLWGMRELTGVRRFPRFIRLIRATEARYPKFPHYYLGAIGAADRARGSGIGGELLRSTLTACDATGVPAYLESSNPRNLSFYWRHGFRVLDELSLGRNAPSLTLMLREPFGRG